jgi:hypothetical protein
MTCDIRDVMTDDPIRGVYPGISREEYMAASGMNPSTLKKAWAGGAIDVVSGKHAYEHRNGKPKQQAKIDQMDRGTLGHMVMLEPERVETDVAIWTGKVRNGNDWVEFQIEHSGKLIVRRVDYDQTKRACEAILDGLQKHPHILGLIAEGQSEVAIYSEEDGMQVRGQMDWVNSKAGYEGIPDLKFTERSLEQHNIDSNVKRFQYDLSMACYARWMDREFSKRLANFTNITFCTTKPYGVAVTRYGPQALEFGWDKAERAMKALKAAIEADEWPMLVLDDDYVPSPWEVEDAEDELVGFE